jgi:hypothetical protein
VLTLLQLSTIGFLGWGARLAGFPAQAAGLVEVALNYRLQWESLLRSRTPML